MIFFRGYIAKMELPGARSINRASMVSTLSSKAKATEGQHRQISLNVGKER